MHVRHQLIWNSLSVYLGKVLPFGCTLYLITHVVVAKYTSSGGGGVGVCDVDLSFARQDQKHDCTKPFPQTRNTPKD